MMKKQNGITLIALVITIIVLLILAGVSIAMLTGDNGILTQATRAKNDTTDAELADKINMALNGEYANLLADGALSGTAAEIAAANGISEEDFTIDPATTGTTVLTITSKTKASITGKIEKSTSADGKTTYTITKAAYPTKTTTSNP